MSLTIKLPKATIKVQIEDQTEPILSLNQLRTYIQSISQQLLEDWVRSQQEACLSRRLWGPWKRLETKNIGICWNPNARLPADRLSRRCEAVSINVNSQGQ